MTIFIEVMGIMSLGCFAFAGFVNYVLVPRAYKRCLEGIKLSPESEAAWKKINTDYWKKRIDPRLLS